MIRRFILIIVLGISSPIFATFVGNTSEPSILMRGIFSPDDQIFRLKVDGVFDRIARRALKRSSKIFPMRSTAGYGGLLLNVWERFDGYLYAGKGNYKIKDRPSKTGFTFQAGGKVVLIQMKDTSLGFDVKYWMIRPFQKSHLRSWQIAGGLTQQVGFFYPYIGFVISRIHARIKREEFRDNHSSSLLFGATFSNGRYLLFNLEGRVIHEKGFSANLGLLF